MSLETHYAEVQLWLEKMYAGNSVPVYELNPLTTGEQHHILYGFNSSGVQHFGFGYQFDIK